MRARKIVKYVAWPVLLFVAGFSAAAVLFSAHADLTSLPYATQWCVAAEDFTVRLGETAVRIDQGTPLQVTRYVLAKPGCAIYFTYDSMLQESKTLFDTQP